MHDEVTQTAPTGADRRACLVRAGLGTAAVATVAAAGPALASTDASASPELASARAAVDGPVMAYIRNAARGEVGVLVGTQEHIIVDKAAVARLLSVAGR
jgi:Rieske Fe-S protein